MTDESARALRYLSGSTVRPTILERLVDGSAQPAELVSVADVSRTTVHRTLSELGKRDWVRRVDGGYEATAIGELALQTYERAHSRFQLLDRLEPFCAHAEAIAAELDLDWLCEARLATPTETNPQYPLEWYDDRLTALERADEHARLCVTTPVLTRQLLAAHDPIADAGTPIELVVDDAALRAVATQSPDRVCTSLSTDAFELYAVSDSPSIGMTLGAERTLLHAYDNGRLVVGLESTNDRLREWATDRYSRLRADTRQVTGETLESLS
ncbi:helix-turn-helix transcriptional regulator [Natrinema sp. HArc-T2]|uniref:helix-turn-helix transcriptional regulator n=1 Tax=Natrinema sp. HArc-T2 TaxID=3242701 RepID=UPI00359D9B1C